MATRVALAGLGPRDITRTEDLQLQLLGLNRLGGQQVLRLRVGTKALTPWNVGCPNATVVIRDAGGRALAHQAVGVWGALNCTEDIELRLPAGTDLARRFQFEIYPGQYSLEAINAGVPTGGIIRQLALGDAIETVESDRSEESWGEWIGGEAGDITAEIIRPLALPLGIAVGGMIVVTNVDTILETAKKVA